MNENKLNIIKGALYGVAVGDALGAPVEFMGAESIQRQHGRVTEMLSGGWLNVEPGEITDDTQMTLCVARGILNSKAGDVNDVVRKVGAEFIKWYHTGPKDVGGTCASSISGAIERGKKTGKEEPPATAWIQASAATDTRTGGRSGGNGSLMRTVYIPLYYADPKQMKATATAVSRMTHFDRKAAEACELYCEIINRIVRSEVTHTGRRTTLDHYDIYEHAILSDSEYAEAMDKDFQPRPTGYSVDSLKAAIWAIERAMDTATVKEFFRKAVENAVNLGGDADTIGAITGGLIGAICGYDSIPESWKYALNNKVKDELNALAEAAAERWEAAALKAE